jgi:hypothetical protein
MKSIILFSSVALASGLIFVNIYTSLVDAKSWGANIPESMAVARSYFAHVNPGNFFRVFSPINQVLGLLAVIVFWRSAPNIRLYLVIAFVMYLLAEGLTFKYFYPRNDLMFRTADLTDTNLLKGIWSEWNSMNWVRTFILVIGVIFSFLSLHRIYAIHTK